MSVEFKDYYRILGVDKSADDKTIKSAYRRLARKYHPDVAKTKDSGERFKEIGEAYEVLSDPQKRQRYDALGPDWQRYAQAEPGATSDFTVNYSGDLGNLGDFSDFFRMVFGDLGGRRTGRGVGFDPEDLFGSRRRSRGQDVQTNVEITLEEAFNGTRRTFALDFDEPCPSCHGAGNVKRQPCATCRGGGWQRVRRQVDVKIPAGVKSGQKVRVSGEGAGGAATRGDLYLAVTVSPHPLFERRGDDIHVSVPITAPEAALGTTIEVPTLKGRVSMKIPPATSSGRVFRLPGYGMSRGKGGGTGDQFATVKIVMPNDLTSAERDLYAKLRAERGDNPRAYQG